MHHGLFSLRMSEELARDPTRCKDPLLKGAALLYKNIVFFSRSIGVKHITEEVSSGLSKAAKKDATTMFLPASALDPKFEYISEFEVLSTIDTLSRGESVNLNAVEYLVDSFIDKSNNRGDTGLYSFHASLRLRIPFHADHEEAAFLRLLFDTPETQAISEHSPLLVSLPAINELSWQDIFELRTSPYLDRYRLFLSSYHLHEDVNEAIAREINEALWDVIGSLKPAPDGSVVKRVVANIPIPLVPLPNPYAVWRDAKEGSKEKKLFTKYGWLWFIQEARQPADTKNEDG